MSVRRVWIVLVLGSLLVGLTGWVVPACAEDRQPPASHAARSSGGLLSSPLQMAAEWFPFSQPRPTTSPAPALPEMVNRPAPHGETVPGMLAMARLVERQGDLAKAEGMYRGILAVDPQHPNALHRLGVVVGQRGNYELAAAVLERAVKQSPGNAELLADLGNAYYQLEVPDKSEQYLRQALKLNPRNDVARNNLAMVLAVQRRTDEALAEFRKVGTEAEAHANLSFVLRQIGEIDAANQHYETAMSMNRTLRRTVGALVWSQPTTKAVPGARPQRRVAPAQPAKRTSQTQSLVRHSRRPPPDPAPKPPTTTAIAKTQPKPSAPSRAALIPERRPVVAKSSRPIVSEIVTKDRSNQGGQMDLSKLGKLQPNYPTTSASQAVVPKRPTIPIASRKPVAEPAAKPAVSKPAVSKPAVSSPSRESLVVKKLKELNSLPKRSPSPTIAAKERRPQAPPSVARPSAPSSVTSLAPVRPAPKRSTTSVARSSGKLAPVVSASSYKKPFDTASAAGVSFRTANIQDGDSAESQDTWLAAYRTLVQRAAANGQKPKSQEGDKD